MHEKIKVNLFLINLIICFTATEPNKSDIWLSSCRPCGDTLNECSTCLREECVQCILEVPFTGCVNCVNDLINLNEKFYCDNTIEYQATVCKIHCRMSTGSVLYKDGYCDDFTGLCTCTTKNLATTLHPLYNRTTTTPFVPCEYKVGFEAESQIQVVHENGTTARVVIQIIPSRSNCVFRDTAKVKVATKQFTAKNGLDFIGMVL